MIINIIYKDLRLDKKDDSDKVDGNLIHLSSIQLLLVNADASQAQTDLWILYHAISSGQCNFSSLSLNFAIRTGRAILVNHQQPVREQGRISGRHELLNNFWCV